ncbi:MAG: ribose 5-phosphate isomerase B [Nitrospirae bacterium]|nr:ribose 5-phosphate isomerase B [Nitrospirota bacterium]
MIVGIGCDHAGLAMKEEMLALLKDLGFKYKDYGTFTKDSVDYPDFGLKVSEAVSKGEVDRGLLICGTGIGMSIVANKFTGVRAALCHEPYSAKMSRLHNDANILVLGGRVIGKGLAREIAMVWFTTEFEGGRHKNRIDKIKEIESNRCLKVKE